MGWAEIKSEIPGIPEHLVKGNFPELDDRELWTNVAPDEIQALANHQVRALCELDHDVLWTVANSQLRVSEPAGADSWDLLAPIISGPDFVDDNTLTNLLTGPLINGVLLDLGVERVQLGSRIQTILEENSGLAEKIRELSAPMKTLLWYGLWFDLKLNFSGRGKGMSGRTDVVSFMESLGLKPPEFIYPPEESE